MSKDNDSEYDGSFDFEEFVENMDENTDDDDFQWDIQLDDEGGLIRNETLPLRYKALAVFLGVLYAAVRFAGALLVLFLLVAGLSFLMGLTGVAIPVS